MLNKGAETLQGKDVQAFKSLAKFHDTKNYKKGLKTAEKLLEANPNHGQTLAMKALFQSGLGDQNKALQTAKLGLLKSQMKSLLCWHTYGTLLKNKKDYVEAAKSFQNALKMDPQNLQLLRQTANLFIQIRDHTNHVAIRYSILKQKPNMIQNWTAFVLAYHLKGDFIQLFRALGSLDNLVKAVDLKPQQLTQYYLYRVLAFKDAQNYQGMYQQLLKNHDKILDKTAMRQYMFQACKQLGKKQQAQKNILQLITQFPQNLQYLEKYQNLTQQKPRQFYKRSHQIFKSKISRIIELSYIQNQQEFKKEFSIFIKPYYQKNLISLYRQIQVLYRSQDKQKWIGDVFVLFQETLKNEKYPDQEEFVSPSEYLWSLYMLSQHYSRHFATLVKAHELICKAIQHTNTVSQLYIIKAQIEYKQHNNLQALKTINQARKTDLADRYMNNICVKYLMKCLKPNIAEDVLRLFMRDQASLYELQNQWYIIQAGKSFLKQRQFGPGLRHLNFIQKQFLDMYGNHYDFHPYCIRKWSLRQYVELIAFNDNLYQDKKYMEAAGNAIQNLIQYNYELQNPKKKQQQQIKQKQQDKANKKKKKKNKKPVVQTQQIKPIQVFRKKIDYYGKQYLQTINKDPLKQALIYATNVASAKYINKNNIAQNKFYYKSFSQSINIFIYFNKPLLAIKCLKKLVKTKVNEYGIHLYTLKTILYLSNVLTNSKDQLIRQFVSDYLKEILLDKSVEQYHAQITNSWKDSQFKSLKLKQCQIVLKLADNRGQYIKLYLSEINKYKDQNITTEQLQIIFYLVHKLQFYGQFTQQLKTQLNTALNKRTTYFTQWIKQIDTLPPSTWSIWWLSDYDQQHQQLNFQEQQKKKQSNNNHQNQQISKETQPDSNKDSKK